MRPGEITYYEELGVENTASADEIRDAFRALARLLHPDQQSDPQLKEMAERQMRKLNRIYAVLSDATRRTAYDASLNSRNAPIIVFSGSDGNLKKLLVRGGAAAAIVFGTFLLIWFMVTSNNEVRGQEPRLPASAKTADGPDDAGDQVARLRDQLRTVETERNSALEQLARLGAKPLDPAGAKSRIAKEESALPVSTTATTATALTELSPSSTAAIPPDENDSKATAMQFAGLWVFGKSGSASPGGKSQYSPEFIDVTVIERNGSLHGQYHSRYQVLDHGISPDVDFTFSGIPTGSTLDCAWQGPGGAKGRLTMKLLPASTVEIAWNATERGTQQWLMNGTAMLNKK